MCIWWVLYTYTHTHMYTLTTITTSKYRKCSLMPTLQPTTLHHPAPVNHWSDFLITMDSFTYQELHKSKNLDLLLLCLASFAQHYLYEFYPSFNFLNFAYCTCPILRILKNKFYESRALILCLPMSGLHPLTWSFVHQALHPPVSLTSPSWASVQLGGCAPDPDTSLFSPLKCHCRRTVLGAPWWPCR